VHAQHVFLTDNRLDFPTGISNVKSRESLVMSSDIPEDPFIAAPFSLPGKNTEKKLGSKYQ
jgi:hypothetical protein